MEPVDDVAAIGDARAYEEDVGDRLGGKAGQGRWDHGAGMAAEHVAVIDIAGVAGITCDVRGGVTKPVVVVGQRDDSRSSFNPDLAVPRRCQGVDSGLHEKLDSVGPGVRIGEVPEREIAAELVSSQGG